MRHSSLPHGATLAAAACLALAGCGEAKKTTAAPAAFRGVYTTSSDCADSGKLTYEQCVTAMEKAVTEHEKTATSFKTLTSCEASEGVNRCERTHLGTYRPVLLAFLVTASTPPRAQPLYAIGDKKVGFRTASKEVFLTSDENITMSRHAQSMAESNVDKKARPAEKFKIGG